jgi:FkbM family methyltransferase
MRLPNPLKPWFLYRPGQLLRRVARALRPPADPIQVVNLPWGCSLEIDTRETIGRSVWTAGVHDLAVVEVLVRLADPALLAIDAGANIGAMTGALAARAGEVWAFEPHPDVFRSLEANVARFAGLPGFAPTRAFDLALSDSDGEARLESPEGFADNRGLGRLAEGGGIPVRTARLDRLLEGREVGVMKVDVEGHELAVLRGAAESLAAGRVRHVLFEDHGGLDSPVCRFLEGLGFGLFAVGWRLRGPRLVPVSGSGANRSYEAPSYLATRLPEGALEACRPRGWVCLRRRRGTGR